MPGATFFLIRSARTSTFSLTKSLSFKFFLLAEYFMTSYLSSLRWSLWVFSIRCMLKTVSNRSPAKDRFSISSGDRPYLVLFMRFMLSVEFWTILAGLIFNFWAFNFDIVVLKMYKVNLSLRNWLWLVLYYHLKSPYCQLDL